MAEIRILIFGDVVGRIGREGLLRALPGLKKKHSPDLVIANAENLAHGKGVNPSILKTLHEGGVDFFTSGNHIFNNQKVHEIWKDPNLKDLLIRPANYPDGTAGEGQKMLRVGEKKVLVINLLCQVFMHEEVKSPFETVDAILEAQKEKPDIVLVDLHGEASSERIAFGLHVDGRVTSVTGTHTHVPTADGRILEKGTAYLTDIGMTGARNSILGVKPEGPLSRFTSDTPIPFDIPTEGSVDINAALITADAETGKAISIEHIQQTVT